MQDTRTNTPSAPGHDPRQANPDPTISWVTNYVTTMDNVFIAGGQFHIYAFDSSGHRTASQMNLKIDGNMFSSPLVQGYAPLGLGTAGSTLTRYMTADYTAATGEGSHNSMSEGQSFNAMQPSATTQNAIPLPTNIASVVHQPAGAMHLGAF